MKRTLLSLSLLSCLAPAGLTQTQQAYLKHPFPDVNDHFGIGLDIDGDTAVVGVRGDGSASAGNPADNSLIGSGVVFVYRRVGGVWVQEASLIASNVGSGDGFGQSVSISGDTIVVGAVGEDSSSPGVNADQTLNDMAASGAAYVFVRTGSSWVQEAYIKASNPNATDWFGSSVSIDGDVLVVGAHHEDSSSPGVDGTQSDNSMPSAGAAYVFRRTAGVWVQEAYLKSPDPGESDLFGLAVTVSGNTVGVGAQRDDSGSAGIGGDPSDNSASDAGSVTLFESVAGVWSPVAYVKPLQVDIGDRFGSALDLDGDTLLVGSPGDDGPNNTVVNAGAGYVFERESGVWAQTACLKAINSGIGDSLGESASIDGDLVVLGAPDESSDAQMPNGDPFNDDRIRSGAAFVYRRTPNGWSHAQYLKASNADEFDYLGWRVGITDQYAIVASFVEKSGDPLDQSDNSTTNAGAAYLFGIPPDPCESTFDDSMEPNDSCAEAVVVSTPAFLSLWASKFDSDFFSVTLADGEALDVAALATNSAADFSGAIWDAANVNCGLPSGLPLVTGPTGTFVPMSYFNKTGGDQTVIIEIVVSDAQVPDCGTYDLSVSVTPALGSSFCTGVVNSTGQVTDLYATGNPDAAANDITLQVCDGVPDKFVFIVGSYGMADPGIIPGGGLIGELCLGNGSMVARFVDTHSGGGMTGATQSVGMFDVDGNYSIYIDMSELPVNPTAGMNADFLVEGMDFHFQAFYRDAPGQANFSSGLTIPWVLLP